ncbi:hypothetical protein Dimus_012601 [Dionaea muscipula]
MASKRIQDHELYFVFMNFDPEYERLRADRTKRGAHELDLYLSTKHDELLARTLQPGTYKRTLSLVIVDGFAVEICDDQVRFFIPFHSILQFSGNKHALSRFQTTT